jgi:hypothetical protein
MITKLVFYQATTLNFNFQQFLHHDSQFCYYKKYFGTFWNMCGQYISKTCSDLFKNCYNYTWWKEHSTAIVIFCFYIIYDPHPTNMWSVCCLGDYHFVCCSTHFLFQCLWTTSCFLLYRCLSSYIRKVVHFIIHFFCF